MLVSRRAIRKRLEEEASARLRSRIAEITLRQGRESAPKHDFTDRPPPVTTAPPAPPEITPDDPDRQTREAIIRAASQIRRRISFSEPVPKKRMNPRSGRDFTVSIACNAEIFALFKEFSTLSGEPFSRWARDVLLAHVSEQLPPLRRRG